MCGCAIADCRVCVCFFYRLLFRFFYIIFALVACFNGLLSPWIMRLIFYIFVRSISFIVQNKNHKQICWKWHCLKQSLYSFSLCVRRSAKLINNKRKLNRSAQMSEWSTANNCMYYRCFVFRSLRNTVNDIGFGVAILNIELSHYAIVFPSNDNVLDFFRSFLRTRFSLFSSLFHVFPPPLSAVAPQILYLYALLRQQLFEIINPKWSNWKQIRRESNWSIHRQPNPINSIPNEYWKFR